MDVVTLYEAARNAGLLTVMTYPASVFVGLAARETVEIDDQMFQVRAIRAVGDGSERRATLSRI